MKSPGFNVQSCQKAGLFVFLKKYFSGTSHIAPLAVFRVIFGGMMFISILRFIANGWIKTQYLDPAFFFSYYGFEWVKPLGETGTYILFAGMAIASLFVMLGLFYKVSIITFFITFSYVELIDKSNYLNHYYFVSIVAFLMVWVPAHRYFSLDVLRKPALLVTQIPSWMIDVFKLQLAVVYFFAGIAKLNYDWLFRAMPLAIWLPSKSGLPLIGDMLTQKWTAYFFSWFGALYDIVIPFLLFNSRTRSIAYFFVLVFHGATALLFPGIGMFPYIMIASALIFLSADFHKNIIRNFSGIFSKAAFNHREDIRFSFSSSFLRQALIAGLCVHFSVQLLLPFRYLLYPGKLSWTEQGYRFSWRVMLIEKGGTAFFYVKDKETGKESEVISSAYLTHQQEKMMATQPDMILQFSKFIAREFEQKGYSSPEVRVESFVTLNGSGTKPFIDSSVNLAAENENFASKKWILPFEDKKMIYAKN